MIKIVGISALLICCVLAGPVSAETSDAAPGYQPAGLAYDERFLYAAELSGFRTIFALDPVTGDVVSSFPAPSPTGLDGQGSPSDIVADGSGSLFVSDIGDAGAGLLYEIDSSGPAILNAFPLPFRGGAVAFDGTDLYVGDLDSGRILVMDRSGERLRTIETKLRPAGMVFDPDAKLLWVISEFDKRIAQVTLDGQLLRLCKGPRQPGSQGLGAITMVGTELYIAEAADADRPDTLGTVFIVDPSTLICDPPLD